MYSFYKKNELRFSLLLIMIYILTSIVADKWSPSLGIVKAISAPKDIIFALLLYLFLSKNALKDSFGLCRTKGKAKDYLFFIPLVVLLFANICNGLRITLSALEAILFIISMLCVGFIEEIIFRGFLFNAMRKDDLKAAIIVSSLTFGLGHITNLLNGAELFPTLLQICYASAIGFLFTELYYRGKSLLPCIITHGLLNSLSGFNVDGSKTQSLIISVAVCVLSVGYALWIIKHDKKVSESKATQ